jgi:glyoxylase-like metal-dependent hydrolase (beta-lactamase superfamily II)
LENLITITIRSTHYYLLDAATGKLMVDAGWAGSLPALKSKLWRHTLSLHDIRYVFITHCHPDHAGLAQEIKQAGGARLVILEHQVPHLESLKALDKGKGQYVPIRIEAGDLVLKAGNRAELARIGVRGEIVATPGHSEDSVSLVLDGGQAFIGDLLPPDFVTDEAREATLHSWRTLLRLNASMAYPAHGNPFPTSSIRGYFGGA